MKPELILKLKEQFKAEEQAYVAYEMLKDSVDDEYLKEALEEIMYDEYLHAKFIRSYLMEYKVYNPAQHEDLEKIYQKMMLD